MSNIFFTFLFLVFYIGIFIGMMYGLSVIENLQDKDGVPIYQTIIPTALGISFGIVSIILFIVWLYGRKSR